MKKLRLKVFKTMGIHAEKQQESVPEFRSDSKTVSIAYGLHMVGVRVRGGRWRVERWKVGGEGWEVGDEGKLQGIENETHICICRV